MRRDTSERETRARYNADARCRSSVRETRLVSGMLSAPNARFAVAKYHLQLKFNVFVPFKKKTVIE